MGGIAGDLLLAQQVVVEAANSRQPSLDTATTQAAAMGAGRKLPYPVGIELPPVPGAGLATEGEQFRQVTSLVFAGIVRQAPLGLQVVQKAIDPCVQVS